MNEQKWADLKLTPALHCDYEASNFKLLYMKACFCRKFKSLALISFETRESWNRTGTKRKLCFDKLTKMTLTAACSGHVDLISNMSQVNHHEKCHNISVKPETCTYCVSRVNDYWEALGRSGVTVTLSDISERCKRQRVPLSTRLEASALPLKRHSDGHMANGCLLSPRFRKRWGIIGN